MKRFTIATVLAASLVLSALSAAYAAVTPGSSCPKAGLKQTYKGKVYTCIKQGKKLVWSKGAVVVKPKPKPTPKPNHVR